MSNEIHFDVYVQPGAKKSEVVGLHGDKIKIKIHSPPVDGRANDALIVFLSKLFEVPKSAVAILSGEKSRMKKVKIKDALNNEKINAILAELKKAK